MQLMMNELTARSRLATVLALLYEEQAKQVMILQSAGFHTFHWAFAYLFSILIERNYRI